MLDWYRQLIRLRRTTPSLNNGEPGQTHVFYSEQEKCLSMERGAVTVSCNLGDAVRRLRVPDDGQVVLSSREATPLKDGTAMLPPDTVMIVVRNRPA
jgi:maltooligosyltrehalose trehalohydrolase